MTDDLEQWASDVRASEPSTPSPADLDTLEKWGAEYCTGFMCIPARQYWTEYIPDCIGFFAKCEGLTRDEYIDWKKSRGTALCGATTKSGSLCKNAIYGAPGFLGVEEWLALHRDGYCRIHGG